MEKNRIYNTLTIFFIALKLIFHFVSNTHYELHRDEMLYFNMADYPAFGYASVPPMIGFFAFIVKSIFGYSVFGIRLLPALLGAASVFIISKIIKELGGGILALIIASTAFLFSPGFLLFNTLFTPNVLEQFLWLLITYFVFRMVKTNKPKLWIVIGFLCAISFMTKYSVVFIIAGLSIGLILSTYRKLLLSKYFLVSILIGFLVIIPNIVWQYWHNWPVLFHMAELNQTQLVNMKFANFITDLFSLNLLSTIIWLFGLIALLFFIDEKKYRYLGISSLLIIILFIVSKGKAYYLIGIISFLFAFGGYVMEKYLKNKLVFINYSILAIVLVTSFIALPFSLPVLSFEKLEKYAAKTGNLKIYPFYRWEDGQIHPVSQVYADMTGWEELALNVSKAYNMLSQEEKKTATIFAEENYGYAGAVHFYGRKYNLPEPITFLDSYTLWAPESITGGTFIYINLKLEDIKELFADIEKVGTVNNKYFRENGLSVYICRNPKTDVQAVYKQLAQSKKAIYNRD